MSQAWSRKAVGAVAFVSCAGIMGVAVAAEVPVGVQEVTADVETQPVAHYGDAADDPSLWVHPTEPGRSLLIGNDKKGALEVYNLDGTRQQRITSSKSFWGNSDVRQGVAVANGRDVVAATNVGLRLYTVDKQSRTLVSIADGTGVVSTGGGEGMCLYESQSNKLFAFVINRAGRVRQYDIHDSDRDGRLSGRLTREFYVGSEAEGCVADDLTGALYIAQEDVALWRYGAEPNSGNTRTIVDGIAPRGNLVADIEGLTLVHTSANTGYLIASAQNTDSPRQSYFAVYRRDTNQYVKAFRISAGANADGCERTDGITAYAGNLGTRFPKGVFVCQDNFNSAPGTGNQDFKLTRLERVVNLQ